MDNKKYGWYCWHEEQEYGSWYYSKPDNKIVVKYNTVYNKDVDCEYEINSLKELDEVLKKGQLVPTTVIVKLWLDRAEELKN